LQCLCLQSTEQLHLPMDPQSKQNLQSIICPYTNYTGINVLKFTACTITLN
jgi:hypothetical protein